MVWSHLYDEYVNTGIDVNACICRKCMEGYTHTNTHTHVNSEQKWGKPLFFFLTLEIPYCLNVYSSYNKPP